MILLCNHKCMAYEKPYAYLEPMSASENCQRCREPYFADAAISIGGILPQIPKQGKHKSRGRDTSVRAYIRVPQYECVLMRVLHLQQY
jgi:hypothetical protein